MLCITRYFYVNTRYSISHFPHRYSISYILHYLVPIAKQKRHYVYISALNLVLFFHRFLLRAAAEKVDSSFQ